MVKDKILDAYNQMASSYNALIDHKPHNAYYDRPNTLRLMGNVEGMKILDAACGPGKYAEELIEQGAEVTGIDLSEEMIKWAKVRNGDIGHFYIQDMSQPLVEESDESYDGIISGLAMHYIEDWTLTLGEFHRVLRSDGVLVLSMEHPFFEYTYFKSKDYFATEHVHCTWNGFGKPIEVHSYRRSLSNCINPLIKADFVIEEILEPKPLKEFEALDPKHYKELNEFPAFMCIKCRKR